VFLDLIRAIICERVSGWRLLRGGILGTVVGMFMMRWSGPAARSFNSQCLPTQILVGKPHHRFIEHAGAAGGVELAGRILVFLLYQKGRDSMGRGKARFPSIPSALALMFEKPTLSLSQRRMWLGTLSRRPLPSASLWSCPISRLWRESRRVGRERWTKLRVYEGTPPDRSPASIDLSFYCQSSFL
jgi:hypothetical protein